MRSKLLWYVFDKKTKRYVRHGSNKSKKQFTIMANADLEAEKQNMLAGSRVRFHAVLKGAASEPEEKRAKKGIVVDGWRRGKVPAVMLERLEALEKKLEPFDLETMANTMKVLIVQIEQHNQAIAQLTLAQWVSEPAWDNNSKYKPTRTMWLNVWVNSLGTANTALHASEPLARSAAKDSAHELSSTYLITAHRVEIPV